MEGMKYMKNPTAMVTMVKKIITMEPAHYQFVIEIYNESRHVSNTMAANVTEKIYKKKKKSKNQKDLKKMKKMCL